MEFRLLGPLEVRHAGVTLPLGGPRQRAVLAHLLLRANTIVPTHRLIEQIWGDEPPEAARNAVQSYVSRLRTALGEPNRIVGRDPGYVLHAASDEIDALRFESLVREARGRVEAEESLALLDEALTLWQGPPLADLADEPSLRGEVARLEELRLQAIEDRIDALLATGGHYDALPELESLVEENPLRERLWAQLMLACYGSGRQADALRSFDRARGVLVEELGVEPSPELQGLYDRILRHDPDLLQTGRRIRNYRLGELIGQGTFGRVYRAVEPQLGREVAIKVIKPDLADQAAFIRRFEAEAQLVARLEHPHIVPLYDHWREPGAAYLVMRLLRGGNLRTILEGPQPSVIEPLRIVDQVASALAFAHRMGVTHSDVKPENVLVDEEGNAYLSDFGIALQEGPDSPDPVEESTSPYLAPELLLGEPPGPHTDVYSLGVVAAQVFGMATSQKGRSGPGPIDDVIRVATSPDPTDRYPNGQELLESIRRASGSRQLPPGRRRNPYRGLGPFTEADAEDFHGRERLLSRLAERLRDPGLRLLAVVGPSGSGKSSVMRAGLIPALRRAEMAGSDQWLIAEMNPGTEPLLELEGALNRVAIEHTRGMAQRLTEGDRLTDIVMDVLPEGSTLLLVIDQFEELFTLAKEDERESFLHALVPAITDADSRLRVVITLRADFYDRPLLHPGLAELLRSGTEVMTPMTSAELERTITLPAARAGLELDPRLVADLVDEVAGQPAALPLLQYTLTEVFERSEDGAESISAYHEIGGIRGALVRTAESIHGSLDTSEQEATRQLFLRLVTLGEGSEDTRRRVPVAELRALPITGEATDRVLDEFGRHRLLSFDRNPVTRDPTVEVAHEALLTEWGRLRGWIDGARDDVRMQRRLEQAAVEWLSSGRDPSYLLRGSRLDQFEAWTRSSQIALSHDERDYLAISVEVRQVEEAASREGRRRQAELERRSSRRLRQLVAVLAAAVLVASGLTVFAFAQQRRADREANIAFARELAAAAVANLNVDPQRSILLALAAIDAVGPDAGDPLKEAVAALHQAVQANRVVVSVPGYFPAHFDPATRLLATSGEDGDITLWHLPGGEPAGILRGHTAMVIQVEITPDGGALVSSSTDGSARRWDLATSTEVCRFVGHTSEVFSMSLSPNGRLLATRGSDNTVRIWDAHTCQPQRTLPYEALGLHFHPDGRRLAIAGWGAEAVVVDTETGEELLAAGSEARDVRFSPDGTLLAVAQGNSHALVVEIDGGSTRFQLSGHEGNVETVDFSPDGSLIATGGQDGTVRVWDARSGEQRLVLGGAGSSVEHVTFDPSGRLLAAGGTSGRVLVWDVTSTGSRELLAIHTGNGPVLAASYDPEGSHIAAANGDGSARVWRADDGELVIRLDREGHIQLGVWWSPDGRHLITTEPLRGGVVTVWDGSGTVLQEFDDDGFTAAIDPSGSLLTTGGDSGEVRVWDMRTGALSFERDTGFGSINEVAWSPDGRVLAAATQGDVVWLWSLHDQHTAVLRGHRNVVNALAWHPDGSRLASAGEDGSIRVWELSESRTTKILSGHGSSVFDLSWSSDGTILASVGADRTLRLWDPNSGDELLVLPTEVVIRVVAISPQGRHLVTGRDDGMLHVYTLDLTELLEIAASRVTRDLTEDECRVYLHRETCPTRPTRERP